MEFNLNNVNWKIRFVNENNPLLTRSNGTRTVGMTSRVKRTVYLSERLKGAFLRKVLCHELVHAAMFSYGVDLDVMQEEVVADIIATYGSEIIGTTDRIFNLLTKVG